MTNRLKSFLGSELLPLYQDGEKLLLSVTEGFKDFSFVVFPFAKVYEGFLKKLFWQIGAISDRQYRSDHWRVGKALNPELEKELRHDESVYDRIVSHCSGVEIADILWNAWKRGRNQIFHYFPDHYQPLSLGSAKSIIAEINQAMEKALEGCKI